MTFFLSNQKQTKSSTKKIIKDSVQVVENNYVHDTLNYHGSFFVSTNLARTLLLTELFRGL